MLIFEISATLKHPKIDQPEILVTPIRSDKRLPFTTLLADAAREVRGYLTPGLRAVLLDALSKNTVLILGPRSLHHLRIEDLLPPMKALHVSAILQLLCYLLPILWLKQI